MFDEQESFSDLVVLNELGDICLLVATPVVEDLLQELNKNIPRKTEIIIYFFIMLHSINNSGIYNFLLATGINIYKSKFTIVILLCQTRKNVLRYKAYS